MIYKLDRIARADYGDYRGFVVRAESEDVARRIVYESLTKDELNHQEEIARIRTQSPMNKSGEVFQVTEQDQRYARNVHTMWLRPEETTCVLIPTIGTDEVIISDFLNG